MSRLRSALLSNYGSFFNNFERNLAMKPAELRVLIDGLARRFENRVHVLALQHGEGAGWGQFLDDPTRQTQVGPYGTSAGLIVRGLAQRGPDQLAGKVATLVDSWWQIRGSDTSQKKLWSQVTRVAMIHLALRLAGIPAAQKTLESVRETLLLMLRTDGMWGNYVIPDVLEDASPRLFTTAIAILSFTLFLPESEAVPQQLIRAADRLEEKFLGTKELPRLHVAALCAAILSAKRTTTSKDVTKKMEVLAYATQPALPDLGVYFYDYEFPDDDARPAYDRDYFIMPTEVLLGIGGLQFGAPAYLKLRSELSLYALLKNIAGFDGFYRPDNEQRVSSLNQSWVAIYLALASDHLERASVVSRGKYAALRYRADSATKDASMLALCCAGILFGIWTESLPSMQIGSFSVYMVKACEAILAWMAARFYAPIFLKQMLPGRE